MFNTVIAKRKFASVCRLAGAWIQIHSFNILIRKNQQNIMHQSSERKHVIKIIRRAFSDLFSIQNRHA